VYPPDDLFRLRLARSRRKPVRLAFSPPPLTQLLDVCTLPPSHGSGCGHGPVSVALDFFDESRIQVGEAGLEAEYPPLDMVIPFLKRHYSLGPTGFDSRCMRCQRPERVPCSSATKQSCFLIPSGRPPRPLSPDKQPNFPRTVNATLTLPLSHIHQVPPRFHLPSTITQNPFPPVGFSLFSPKTTVPVSPIVAS